MDKHDFIVDVYCEVVCLDDETVLWVQVRRKSHVTIGGGILLVFLDFLYRYHL